MDDNYRHRPYAKLALPNADEHAALGSLWGELYMSPYAANVPWDLSRYYTVEYRHIEWCHRSCSSRCNPMNREQEREWYIHNQDCTGGCDNCCVEQYEIQEAARVERYCIQEATRSACASTEVPDPRTGCSGWGSSSRGNCVAVSSWGRPGEH